jgi:hypothetical protein
MCECLFELRCKRFIQFTKELVGTRHRREPVLGDIRASKEKK